MTINTPLVSCEAIQTWPAASAISKAKRTAARKNAIAQAVLVLAALAGMASTAQATVYFAAAPVNPGLDANAVATGSGSLAAGIGALAAGPYAIALGM